MTDLSKLKHLGKPPRDKRHRPAIPDSVVLAAALRQGIACGCGCGRMIYAKTGMNRDHRPPLYARGYDPKTRKYTPDANDPAFIELLLPEHHDERTFGKGATTKGSDLHDIDHTDRLAKGHAKHKLAMANKGKGKTDDR